MTWDPLVRIFHWSLAGFFFLAYFLQGDWLAMHSHAGYTVGLLVAFRCLWGVIGSRHARFADFVARPGAVVAYLKQLVRGDARPRLGHDPAGAVMIVLLLISLLVTTFAGMSLFGMEGSGPFAGTFVSSWPAPVVEDVHVFSADFTLALVIVHVSGVLFMSVLQRENLIRAMITGRKRSRS
jgi:cytochrome b